MFKKEKIKQLQEILMNCWPAYHYFFLNGWILRFTDGVTARANSVFPLNYHGTPKDLDKDLNLVEKAYNVYKLPAIFTIPEVFEPYNLDLILKERGYQQLGCTTHTMIISIESVRDEVINEKFAYILHSKRVEEISNFLAKYSKRNQEEQKILEALTNRIVIPQKRFIIAKYDNKVVGTLLGILDPHGYLYIVDVLVDPNFRQQKIATSMFFKIVKDRGISNGIKKIWLQVEVENQEAMKLYTKLGFEKAYSYYYLKKS